MRTQVAWNDLPQWARTPLKVLAVIEVALLLAALTDLWRRPSDQVRGGKLRWTLISFIEIIGPLAYFRFGRRRG